MSILSALKARGAKGKNIEEAVKTLPLDSGGGGGESGILFVHADGNGKLDHTYNEVVQAGYAILPDGDPTAAVNLLPLVTYAHDIQNDLYGLLFIALAENEPSMYITSNPDDYPVYTPMG